MEENNLNRNNNSSNLVSRNAPIAFIVGVAGFLGSHLAERLIAKNIQVIGIDDFSFGSRKNLENLTAKKNFHFINSSILDPLGVKQIILDLPHLDYAFFVPDSDENNLYSEGILNFLHLLKDYKESEGHDAKTLRDKPKVIFVSSLKLYDNKLNIHEKSIKEAEVKFAKFVKYYKLNARIVRLSAIYGPRMNFREDDPCTRLIQAALLDKIQSENITSEFSTRALYIDDAVDLIIKATLSGGTSHHIFDGARISPIKVEELKQILIDPLWYENRNFEPTEIPPWPSPNLKKTMTDLSWKVKSNLIKSLKETLHYFRENEISVDPIMEKSEVVEEKPVELNFKPNKKWSFYASQEEVEESDQVETEEISEKNHKSKQGSSKWFSRILLFIILAVIGYGLILPIVSLGVGALTIRGHINQSRIALESGDFNKAQKEITSARTTLQDAKIILDTSKIISKSGVLSNQINALNTTILVADNALDGINHAIIGSKDLFQTTKVIVGEDSGDNVQLFDSAQTELNTASQKLAKAQADLKSPEVINNLPKFLLPRVTDLGTKLGIYEEMVDKARTASILLPELIGVDGNKKTYLVLFQNNLELRPTGGFIGSYGVLSFDNGRLSNIKVDDIYNLDGTLQEVIAPPTDLKTDLGLERLFLRDANYEADFPTSAKIIETLYKKESGQAVNGVIAMDLTSSGNLLTAVGGVDLPEYNEKVDGNNLFERAITHAEVGFFPGSQAKKNYLTALQNQLFNKVFYVSSQNWPAIIQALGTSLEQKHLQVYLSDDKLFSYLSSENWAGVVPRGTEVVNGEFNDFLAVNESNMGANKSNFYLERKYRIDTSIDKNGGVYHVLAINYKNSSPSEVFPAGKYRNRIKLYLPTGAKLTKAIWGERDITSTFLNFSDYGRTGYSSFIEVLPKEQKTLVIEYNMEKGLTFKDKKSEYRFDVIKQAGTGNDPLEWNLTYPINFTAERVGQNNEDNQEINISTDLLTDRSFLINFFQK